MEIIVGKLAGFCGGVVNSVTKTEQLLDNRSSIYCLGELVHNKQVVDKLESKGLRTIDRLSEAEEGSEVIIRAHGVSDDIYTEALERNIKLYDLTCPKVLKIHEQAQELVKKDFFIILIAQKNHPEAIGTISFCGDNSIILENVDNLDILEREILNSGKKNVAIISQTTFSVLKFESYVEEIKNVLEKSYKLEVYNTICSATELRQKEVKEIAATVDAMIIIGGKNSSNTKKLYEISLNECENSFILETVKDIKDDLSIYSKIGVMAGASTPKESIDEVIQYLRLL